MQRRRWLGIVLLSAMAAAWPLADGSAAGGEAEEAPRPIERLEEVVVQEKGGAPGLEVSPGETVIDVDDFPTIGLPDSVLDVLKTQAIVDFRGESDLDPGIDSVYLRGFDSSRFVTALDGLTVQKTGGRKSSNIVDYAMLPAFLVDRIEILPGPHWAAYDAKAIGGVLNFVSQRPRRRESLKPELTLNSAYSSYDTLNSNAVLRGSISAFTYDLSYLKYRTDGYLRNSAIDQDTVYGRLGFVLPGDGFITLSAAYSDVDREAPVHNPAANGTDHDSSYPEVSGGQFDPWQRPTWDSLSTTYRLNYEQSLAVGRVSLGGYYGADNRDRAYYAKSTDTDKTHMDTDWWQQGGKVMDEIGWTPNQTTTVGVDIVQLFDDQPEDHSKRLDKQGVFLQHRWDIVSSLAVTAGARYEDLKVWIYDNGTLKERQFSHLIPKSFTTLRLDRLASWLRDTSLSAGISKIWHAPDAHGTYNPQGRPLGLNLEPEHGMGYDFILERRLWRDIGLNVDYSYYDIEDFFASSVNVKEVHRQGVDAELGGHLTEALSFYASWAWQTFENKGGEEAGATNVDQRAKNRVAAGIRYALFEPTLLLLDYAYQSDEVTEIWETDLATGNDVLTGYQKIPAYNVFDIGIQQTLFKRAGWFREAVLGLWVKNLTDEEYCNSTGYPAVGRTCGVSLSLKM